MLTRAAELAQQALLLVLTLSLPALLAAAALGVVVGLLAAATQINDSALSFTPRLLGVTLVIVTLGGWGASTLLRFTVDLWRAIPVLVR